MNELILVPEPREIVFKTGSYLPLPEWSEALAAFTIEKELPAGISLCRKGGSSGTDSDSDTYCLEIREDGVFITSAGQHGVFYAVQTLRQILRQPGKEGLLPCCAITDSPDYPVRSILYDISRDRVPSMATLFSLVDLWSELKFNQLQLYTEHTFAYSKHKTVWRDASPFTTPEIRQLKLYCRDRGIELIPNQNSFGHMERWLVHKEYHHLAESPDGFTDKEGVFWDKSSTLSPAVDATLDFLGELYDELLPNFNSEYINIGGDEPWELGMGRSRALCKKEGLEQIYLDYIKKIYNVAGERGKKIQVYADILMNYPSLVKELPEDVLLINWGYEANHPFWKECDLISRSGRAFHVCTGTSSWNSLGGRWSNARENILNGAVNGLKNGALGFIVSEWGDNGHWQQLTSSIPGWFLGGAAAWNIDGAFEFDPVKSVSLHWLGGNRKAGKALMKLQDVWEQSRIPLHNISLPAVLLLDPVYPYYRDAYRMFREYGFEDELKLLKEADDLIKAAGNGADAGTEEELLLNELAFTSRLLGHGCRLGQSMLSTDDLTIARIPEETRNLLARELSGLMDEYRRLWNLRSRPGGLKESIGRMEVLKSSYLAE